MSFSLSESRGAKSTKLDKIAEARKGKREYKSVKNAYSWGEKASSEGATGKFLHKVIRFLIWRFLPGFILLHICMFAFGGGEEGTASLPTFDQIGEELTPNEIAQIAQKFDQDEECANAVNSAYSTAITGDAATVEREMQAALKEIDDTCAGDIRRAMDRATLQADQSREFSMMNTEAEDLAAGSGSLTAIESAGVGGMSTVRASQVDCDVCPRLTFVQPGIAIFPDQPLRYVPYSFFVTRSEITLETFQAFVNETGYKASNKCFTLEGQKWKIRKKRNFANPGTEVSPNRPVTCVSFDDANVYASWLSQKTGKSYRLPTIYEWARMAHVSTSTQFEEEETAEVRTTCQNWNAADIRFDLQDPRVAKSDCDDGYSGVAPADTFIDNAGFSNLVGNVWEWTVGYVDPEEEPRQMLFGGSWATDTRSMTPNVMSVADQSTRSSMIGFRLIRDLDRDEIFVEEDEDSSPTSMFRGRS